MKKNFILGIILCCTSAVFADNAKELVVASPNGKQVVKFRQIAQKNDAKQLVYNVSYDGKTVLRESQAGLQLDNKVWEHALAKKIIQPECWMDNFEVDSVSYSSLNETWEPVVGERSIVRNNYNAGTMYLSKKDGSKYRINVEVRAYDEGVGFRYYFPEHPDAIFHKVIGDLTEYTFESGANAWVAEWAQAPYKLLPIDDIKEPAERALTVELPNGLWVSLTDADVDDWCQTRFVAAKDKANTLASDMYSMVDVVTYAATPWKVILVAERAGDLIEHNDIVLNFNPPCEIKNIDYIKPGTMFRDVTLTTESALAAVDFCVEYKIPYVLFCWKWYMPVTSHDGNALKPVDKLDLPRAIAYAKEKGIDVWLYLNQHALMKSNIDEVLATIKSWGVVGIKPGFVEYCSHRWAIWIHDIVRLAAKHELMVNIHDEFRPSGFSRTYPNLITQEGIRGNEEFPDATHNTVLPFTRMINGAGDYTICYFDKRLKNTHAHQLALSLIMFSPVESVFWYDIPSRVNNEPELEWFKQLKTTFDDSRVLEGYPGKNITMARRNRNEWWVGAITNNEPSQQSVNLSFLDDDKTYLARIYTDGGDEIKTTTHVRCSYLLVTNKQILKFNLQARGGAAIHLTPIDKSKMKQYKKYHGQIL
mgnify:FL=1